MLPSEVDETCENRGPRVVPDTVRQARRSTMTAPRIGVLVYLIVLVPLVSASPPSAPLGVVGAWITVVVLAGLGATARAMDDFWCVVVADSAITDMVRADPGRVAGCSGRAGRGVGSCLCPTELRRVLARAVAWLLIGVMGQSRHRRGQVPVQMLNRATDRALTGVRRRGHQWRAPGPVPSRDGPRLLTRSGGHGGRCGALVVMAVPATSPRDCRDHQLLTGFDPTGEIGMPAIPRTLATWEASRLVLRAMRRSAAAVRAGFERRRVPSSRLAVILQVSWSPGRARSPLRHDGGNPLPGRPAAARGRAPTPSLRQSPGSACPRTRCAHRQQRSVAEHVRSEPPAARPGTASSSDDCTPASRPVGCGGRGLVVVDR